MDVFVLLEEVTELLACIEPDLPFAHFALHQAALARTALETELVNRESGPQHSPQHSPQNILNIMPLKILRTIARTPIVPTSLKSIIDTGDVGLVWCMVHSGKAVDEESLIYAFIYACEQGHTEIVRFLLDLDELSHLENRTGLSYVNCALKIACEKGHTEIVRQLLFELPLARGVNPAALDNEPLRVACRHGHIEIARMLLDLPLARGVNPAAFDNESFIYACYLGHTEIAQLLLDLPKERGVDLSARGNVALINASDNNVPGIVRLLLEQPPKRGVNPSDINFYDYAFQIARDKNHTEIVRLFKAKIPWTEYFF